MIIANLAVPAEDLKMLREDLCWAHSLLLPWYPPHGHSMDRLQHLIDEIDKHRPLDQTGTHGELHTISCGCEGYR